MKIGVVKEIKDQENRVALTPAGADTLVRAGHAVLVQAGAGVGSAFADEEYRRAGAQIVTAEAAWDAELVIKVKEPLEAEYRYLKNQWVFTYFHLAGAPKALTEALLASGTTALAYETLEDERGKLPLLAPMSAVAGNMAVTVGSYYLAKFNGGKGVQLGRVLGQRHGKVVILGDGVVGRHAGRTAAGMGAEVWIGGLHAEHVPDLRREIPEGFEFFLAQPDPIARHLEDADLLVGAVLHHGAKAPHLVTESMVRRMQPGSVIVDVSIDQGGCVETSRPTSHSDPVFVKHGVIHYAVTNMPGAYPRTSTLALTAATLPYILELAEKGVEAPRGNPGFAKAVNVCQGYVTCRPVAEALGLLSRYREAATLIGVG
ncbi:MAG TPA: alanine dehydrogenase [Methylococcaceae bacterium]|nr:alanine dehydrogenase [Methylococcaceae bacterium]